MRESIIQPQYAWLLGIIGLAAILVTALVDYGVIEKGNDLIGWIQAVGSILAIIAAALIAMAQHSQEQEAKRGEDDERRKGLIHLIMFEVVTVHGWTERARALIDGIAKETQGERRVHQDAVLPPRTVMMDRLAEQLILLGGTEAVCASQILALMNTIHQFAGRWFEDTKVILIAPSSSADRNRIVFLQNSYNDLFRLTERLIKSIGREHDAMVAMVNANEKERGQSDE